MLFLTLPARFHLTWQLSQHCDKDEALSRDVEKNVQFLRTRRIAKESCKCIYALMAIKYSQYLDIIMYTMCHMYYKVCTMNLDVRS